MESTVRPFVITQRNGSPPRGTLYVYADNRMKLDFGSDIVAEVTYDPETLILVLTGNSLPISYIMGGEYAIYVCEGGIDLEPQLEADDWELRITLTYQIGPRGSRRTMIVSWKAFVQALRSMHPHAPVQS